MDRYSAPSWFFTLWLLMILVLHSHQADSPADAENKVKLETKELRQATMNPSSYRETMAKQAREAIQSCGQWSMTKATGWLDVSLRNAKEVAGLLVDKVEKARDSLCNIARKGKEKFTDSSVSGGAENAEEAVASTEEVQSAKKAYQQAKERAHETYKRAKATMEEEQKTEYEAVKEEKSDAIGNLGSKLRNRKEEL